MTDAPLFALLALSCLAIGFCAAETFRARRRRRELDAERRRRLMEEDDLR